MEKDAPVSILTNRSNLAFNSEQTDNMYLKKVQNFTFKVSCKYVKYMSNMLNPNLIKSVKITSVHRKCRR